MPRKRKQLKKKSKKKAAKRGLAAVVHGIEGKKRLAGRLAKKGDVNALQPLRELMAASHQYSAVSALGPLAKKHPRYKKPAFLLLKKALFGRTDFFVKAGVAESLALIETREAVLALEKAFEYENSYLSNSIAESLGLIKEKKVALLAIKVLNKRLKLEKNKETKSYINAALKKLNRVKGKK